jgi:hypothetical protein
VKTADLDASDPVGCWQIAGKNEKAAYLAFKRFFKYLTPDEWKDELHDLMEFALGKASFSEACVDFDTLTIYFHLTKLVEAAHIIDVREITHIGGSIKKQIEKEILVICKTIPMKIPLSKTSKVLKINIIWFSSTARLWSWGFSISLHSLEFAMAPFFFSSPFLLLQKS